MKQITLAPLAAAALLLVAPLSGHAALSSYTQNFEGLNKASSTALGSDSWLFFAFRLSPSYYQYAGPAPNGTGAISSIDSGEGGPAQGNQQLVVFSDYKNGDHGAGNFIEVLVFQERKLVAGDTGDWTFHFDAKKGNLEKSSTAYAFLKVLNPNDGYKETRKAEIDMTSISASWNHYAMSVNLDASLAGQILQFGFANRATSYQGSGIFYDNISFATAPVPEPATYALMFAGLGLVGAVARRRAAAARS
jgi:hypothetical protein